MAFLDQLPPAGQIDQTVDKLRNQVLSQIVTALQAIFPRVAGTFTLAAAATTTVPQPATQSTSNIALTPLNASAATLQGSAKALYISSRTAGSGFVVATASGGAAAGTEQFQYVMVSLV